MTVAILAQEAKCIDHCARCPQNREESVAVVDGVAIENFVIVTLLLAATEWISFNYKQLRKPSADI